eukprot:TRINITY_DN9499_c0_g1_i1.p1 TRINITY_DN9499_c0_g1~~TRINITY_DN9499_c0_g1_i1.p1  ORF type:complete len:157 (+),score=49.01 TRINITY_DN9499_c0_g1_i1:1-471(+)
MNSNISNEEFNFYLEALNESKLGLEENGIPIGSILVHDKKIIGRGHNQRIQKKSSILHGEMDALEKSGRLKAEVYQNSVLYTTLSPCSMCSGAILLYKIPKVIIGENRNFKGEEELLKQRGVEVIVLDHKETYEMMGEFIKNNPTLWNEDIGEIDK